jgi:hypothetical protein
MVFSRSVPQQIGQISPLTPGQERRARLFSHNLQGVFTGDLTLSYHRGMARTDVYLKVEIDLDEKEKPDRIAAEICRMIRRIYGVRNADVTNMVERDNS